MRRTHDRAAAFRHPGRRGITPSALIAPATENPEVELYAVAARNRSRAEEFAAAHGIFRVHDTYEDLLADADVDAVYIPLPNSEHGRWTAAALDAGKHVLVEKPFASNAEEARAVAARAEASDRVVMEAFHYRYHALFEEALRLVRSGAIGDLVDVSAWFVDSDITAKVTLPTIKYSGYISGVIEPLRPWPKIVENTMAMTIIISSGLSTDHATPRTLRRYLILKSLVTS